MHIGTTTKLLFVLAVTVLVVGLSACDQIQQLLLPGIPEPETPAPIEERDHVWVVDQNGVEVPIPGTWVLVRTHQPKFDLYHRRKFHLTARHTAPDFAVGGNIYGR